MLNKTILHYKILEKLGEGGMGVVYKAEDTKLKRDVAIKFLPQHVAANAQNRQRFKMEAQAAAALNHPNIAHVYAIEESGSDIFIVMEYIDGQEIKERVVSGKWQVAEIVNLAIQIARGLQAAHQKEIVHRDIKSANIMLTREHQIKIMDFGLAMMRKESLSIKSDSVSGTADYMSPEQAKDGFIDHRTDIWSFGVVLYEMLTGELPFKGDYEQAVFYAISNEIPQQIFKFRKDVPVTVQQVVEKMLQKNVNQRYQTASEIIADLETINPVGAKHSGLQSSGNKINDAENASPLRSSSPSIAVLPFVNMSTDPENEYFSDGLAEDLINALTQIKDLHVVARTSAFSFKGKNTDVREIGKQLNVKSVLEGSVRKAGNRLRITAQLIDVADGFHRWSEQYDRVMDDVFAIQDEITLAIVEKLKIKLLRKEKKALGKRRIDNRDAFNLFLKGRYFWNNRTKDGMQKSIEYFQQAIEIEPNYALAYVGICDAYSMLGAYNFLPPKDSYPIAKQATLKAIEIDDTLAEAYASLGYVVYEYDWDWAGGEKAFLRAIELNPGVWTAHAWYAHYLMMLARLDEAEKEMKIAQKLDPLGLITNANVGYIHHLARDYRKAISEYQRTLEIDPAFYPALDYLGEAYLQLGEFEQAIEAFNKALVASQNGPDVVVRLGYLYGVIGENDKARKMIDELLSRSKKEFIAASGIALIYMGLNETDKAFEWLKKAYEERAPFLTYLKVDPRFDRLRDDPRFIDLMRRVGLK